MTQWEHMTVCEFADKIDAVLNTLGSQGWEACGLTVVPVYPKNRWFIVLKRQIVADQP